MPRDRRKPDDQSGAGRDVPRAPTAAHGRERNDDPPTAARARERNDDPPTAAREHERDDDAATAARGRERNDDPPTAARARERNDDAATAARGRERNDDAGDDRRAASAIDAGDDDSDDDSADLAAAPAAAVQHRFAVSGDGAGERIDALIAAAIAELSRAQVQRLIDDARVRLNGTVVTKPGQRVRAGDAVAIDVPPAEPIAIVPEDLPLAILHEDADIIVVDKPAGLVVHPAAGHPRGTLVNALLFHCRDLSGIGGALRPGIVHRLDKDTSGALVATKNDRAHAALAAAFAAKSRGEPGGILREYLAIAAPPPPTASGTLRTYHGRHPTDRKRFSSRVASGKLAVTHWTTVEPLPGAALVRLRLETGRTHQIRVHAADHGWPLLGDPLYGRTPRALAATAQALGRQALHAAVLELDHPVTGARLRFESPLPADLTRALAELRAGA